MPAFLAVPEKQGGSKSGIKTTRMHQTHRMDNGYRKHGFAWFSGLDLCHLDLTVYSNFFIDDMAVVANGARSLQFSGRAIGRKYNYKY